MNVLHVGDSVILLRFFPDGRRLLVGTATDKGVVHFDILSLPGGERVRLPLPPLDIQSWYRSGEGLSTAVHPSGEWCYIAWSGQLFSFRTPDGTPRSVPDGVRGHQVVLSPAGDRLVAAEVTVGGRHQLSALTVAPAGDAVVWHKVPPPQFRHVAGFLADGEQFVTIDSVVRLRAFATGEERGTAPFLAARANKPQMSPDGRHLGVTGHSSLYVYDLAGLGKPRRISSGSNFGNFAGFAFHPEGHTMAVIHGGPTLVKLYDVESLKLTAKFNWKVGALASIAFSPDGMLGAAGSRDGRVVLWDVDP